MAVGTATGMAIGWPNSIVVLMVGYVGLGILVAPLVLFWGASRFDSSVLGSTRGIPPSFVMRDHLGGRLNFLLVDAEGRGLGHEILDRVGRTVRVSGEVLRYDDLLVLRADPAAIEPLPQDAG